MNPDLFFVNNYHSLYPPTFRPKLMSRLSTFEEVMTMCGYEDTMRLSSYSMRELRRYHPYIRLLTPSLLEGQSSNQYMHTIYDEESVELNVPPFLHYDLLPSLRQPVQLTPMSQELQGHISTTTLTPPATSAPTPAVPEPLDDTSPVLNTAQRNEERDRERIERSRLRGVADPPRGTETASQAPHLPPASKG